MTEWNRHRRAARRRDAERYVPMLVCCVLAMGVGLIGGGLAVLIFG